MEKVTDVKKKGGALKGIIGLVVIIGFLWFYFGGGDTKMAQNKIHAHLYVVSKTGPHVAI